MSVFETARDIRDRFMGESGSEMDEPHGGTESSGPGALVCDKCGASQTNNGKDFTAATLALHRARAHGIPGAKRGRGGPKRDKKPGTPRTSRDQNSPRTPPPRRAPAPTVTEIREAFDSAEKSLREYAFHETAEQLADISGMAARGLEFIGSKNRRAAIVIRVGIAFIGGGIAIFGLAKVGSIFLAEWQEHRAIRRGQYVGGGDIEPANAFEQAG